MFQVSLEVELLIAYFEIMILLMLNRISRVCSAKQEINMEKEYNGATNSDLCCIMRFAQNTMLLGNIIWTISAPYHGFLLVSKYYPLLKYTLGSLQ